MACYAWHKEGGAFGFELTRVGRLRFAFRRFGLIALSGTVLLSLIMLPDYIGRYRDMDPIPGLFFMSMFGISALMGFAFSLARMARRETWVVDPKNSSVVLNRTVFGARREPEGMDLEHVRVLEFDLRSFGLPSRVTMVLCDAQRVEIMSGPRDAQSFERLYLALAEFISVKNLNVDVVYAQSVSG